MEPDWSEIIKAEILRELLGGKAEAPRLDTIVVTLGISIRFHGSPFRRSRIGRLIIGQQAGKKYGVIHSPAGTFNLEQALMLAKACQAKRVFGLGVAGGLHPDMAPGSIIIPSEGVCGDGLSRYFWESDQHPEATPCLVEALHANLSKKYRVFKGRIFTTGSLLAETDEFIEKLVNQDIIGIECEAAALFALCSHLGMDSAVILAVSDLPSKKQIYWNKEGKFRLWLVLRAARRAILKTISDL